MQTDLSLVYVSDSCINFFSQSVVFQILKSDFQFVDANILSDISFFFL